jgi:hypothetical protein
VRMFFYFFYKISHIKNTENVKLRSLNSNTTMNFIKHKNIHYGQEVVLRLFWRIKL